MLPLTFNLQPSTSEPLDGLIVLNKPTGITSAKALYRVRKLTGQRKSGHAGTLDPGASGVLVLCLGKATKLVESIMDQPKVYSAAARLDVISESHDADSPLEAVAVPDAVSYARAIPSPEAIMEAFGAFEGAIEQVPPRISAVKIGGQPAYKLARAVAARARDGRVASDPRVGRLELRPRRVMVYWILVRAYEWPIVEFEMCCGRGTYVRLLIRDVGERLATGGCLTSLVRRRVGPFQQEDACTFEDIECAAAPSGYLIGLEAARAALARRPITARCRKTDGR